MLIQEVQINITKKNILAVLGIPQLYKHLEATFLPRGSGIRHETRLAKIMDSLSAKGMITYREIEVSENFVTETEEGVKSETKKVKRKQYMTFEVFEARYQPKVVANVA